VPLEFVPKRTRAHTHTKRPVTNVIRSNSCSKVVFTCATRDSGQRVGFCVNLLAGQAKNWGSIYGICLNLLAEQTKNWSSIYGRGKKIFFFPKHPDRILVHSSLLPDLFSYLIIVRRVFDKSRKYLVSA